jgi:hypothetical protein
MRSRPVPTRTGLIGSATFVAGAFAPRAAELKRGGLVCVSTESLDPLGLASFRDRNGGPLLTACGASARLSCSAAIMPICPR